MQADTTNWRLPMVELLAALEGHAREGDRATAALRSHRRVTPEEVEKLRALGYVQ